MPNESQSAQTPEDRAERLRMKIRQSVLALMENPLTNVRADWLKEGIQLRALLEASTALALLRMWIICAPRSIDDIRDPAQRQSLKQDLEISLRSLQALTQLETELPDQYPHACRELQDLIDLLE